MGSFSSCAKTQVSKTELGSRPFLTNAFLKQTKNNLKNLSDTKVLYVTKGCLQNLARAKSALRAQNLKKSIFGATDLYPPYVTLPHQNSDEPRIYMSSKLLEVTSRFF